MPAHPEQPPLESITTALAEESNAVAATPSLPREIQLPSGLLEDLQAIAGAEALETAGRRAGTWLAAALGEALATEELSQAPTQAFWDALGEILRGRGWGRLRQERVHSGLGVVVAEDWMETGSSDSPGCPFTIGLLGALFEQVAGEPVAVLQTAFEGHEEECRFVFGSEAAVRELRARLEDGVSEEAALAGF